MNIRCAAIFIRNPFTALELIKNGLRDSIYRSIGALVKSPRADYLWDSDVTCSCQSLAFPLFAYAVNTVVKCIAELTNSKIKNSSYLASTYKIFHGSTCSNLMYHYSIPAPVLHKFST